MCFMPKVKVPPPPPPPTPDDANKADLRERMRRANFKGFEWSVYKPAGDVSQASTARPTILGG